MLHSRKPVKRPFWRFSGGHGKKGAMPPEFRRPCSICCCRHHRQGKAGSRPPKRQEYHWVAKAEVPNSHGAENYSVISRKGLLVVMKSPGNFFRYLVRKSLANVNVVGLAHWVIGYCEQCRPNVMDARSATQHGRWDSITHKNLLNKAESADDQDDQKAGDGRKPLDKALMAMAAST